MRVKCDGRRSLAKPPLVSDACTNEVEKVEEEKEKNRRREGRVRERRRVREGGKATTTQRNSHNMA
ncbi:MAG: hypothetical protein Q8778_02640, partial [Sweet potato little leaf phytoplasma]|nr:hypothetical protein [Sweet potato little leaf phytoplasma]